MSTDLYYDDTNGIIDSNITIEINGAKCVITCVDGKLHAEGDMDVGAQGLFEQVCEMWNTRIPQWQSLKLITVVRSHIEDLKRCIEVLSKYPQMESTMYQFMLAVDELELSLPTPPKEQP